MPTLHRPLFALFACLVTGAGQASPLYVDATALAGARNGTSWADAYTDLQAALAAASSDASIDEIWVARGIYTPVTPADPGNVTQAERLATFQLVDGVALYGGFAGGETERSQRDWRANVTVLSGDIDGNDTNADGNHIAETADHIQGDNSYNVITSQGTGTGTVLDGFTVTAGLANGEAPPGSTTVEPPRIEAGGGLVNLGGSPTIRHVTFSGNRAHAGGGLYSGRDTEQDLDAEPQLSRVVFIGNHASVYGGGMAIYSTSDALLEQVVFTANTANQGAGMLTALSTLTLKNVLFQDNIAVTSTHSEATAPRGGGMLNMMSTATLDSVTFSGNAATDGGGMHNMMSPALLSNVTFSANSASEYGGGMLDQTAGFARLKNVTFHGNTAALGGGGIYAATGSELELINVLVAASAGGDCRLDANTSLTAASSNNLMEDSGADACGLTDGSKGNIVGGAARLDDTLRDNGGIVPTHALLGDAPAIDAGTACAASPGIDTTGCPTHDGRGVPRPQSTSGQFDIGAFERVQGHHSLSVHVSGQGHVGAAPAGISECRAGSGTCSMHTDADTVTLTATPDSSQAFLGWGGGCTSLATACVVPMGTARSVSASFTFNRYTVSFDSNGGSAVTALTHVPHGSTLSPPATPTRTGHAFTGWYADSTLETPWDFDHATVTAPLTLHAGWQIDQYALSTSVSAGSGTLSCTPNPVSHGGTALCAAVPAPGFQLAGWSGACNDSNTHNDNNGGTCTLTGLDGPRNVTAHFTPWLAALLTLAEGPWQGEPLSLALPDGGAGNWVLAEAATQATASVGTPPPAGIALPHGLVRLRLIDGTPGTGTTVVLTYPEALPAGTRYYKYGPSASTPEPHWYDYPLAQIDGNTIRLPLTDGGQGDADRATDGTILDPGGPAVPAGSIAAIPTLSQWAALLLAGSLGWLTASHWRRRRDH